MEDIIPIPIRILCRSIQLLLGPKIMTNILLFLILIALVFGGATVIKIVYAVGSILGIVALYVVALAAFLSAIMAYGWITNDALFLLTFSMRRWLKCHIKRNLSKADAWRVSLAELYEALPGRWKDRFKGWPVEYEFTDEIRKVVESNDFIKLELSLEGETEGFARNRLDQIFLIAKRA